MKRRTFLATSAALGFDAGTACRSAPGSGSNPSVGSFELDEVGVTDIAAGLRAGKWTSRKLVELYSARIEALDRNGPRLGAIIELNPDAEALAAKLDEERRAGRLRGPLHGVPILVKDNIETGDRMRTSAGSLALENWRAPRDAFVAGRLRTAGALIAGKTNLSEWANFRSAHSTSGWSGRGGQTRNPYALDRCPSGSSSGSAVAVAASLCATAIGTETDGSVTSPSSINGLVGIKPTVGLVSRSGIIPISVSQDTAGPMARSVRDAAILLGAMTGVDPQDPATAASQGKVAPDYTQFLDPDGLRGARIGVARKFFENSAALDRFLSGCVDPLRKAGAEAIDPADLPTHGQIDAPELEVLLYEFKDGLNRYLSRLDGGSPARSLRELIEYNEARDADLRAGVVHPVGNKGAAHRRKVRQSPDRMYTVVAQGRHRCGDREKPSRRHRDADQWTGVVHRHDKRRSGYRRLHNARRRRRLSPYHSARGNVSGPPGRPFVLRNRME
jgi:amidase